jgi:hypothetical protein
MEEARLALGLSPEHWKAYLTLHIIPIFRDGHCDRITGATLARMRTTLEAPGQMEEICRWASMRERTKRGQNESRRI